jgi:uncharacterized coiled-coil DUF342 family protein
MTHDDHNAKIQQIEHDIERCQRLLQSQLDPETEDRLDAYLKDLEDSLNRLKASQ